MPNAPETPAVVNLLEATPPQLSKLRQAVEAHQGRVQVAVHPYYFRVQNGAFEPRYESPIAYREKRDRFLEAILRKHVPTIIFEEAYRSDGLLYKLPQVTAEVHLIETRTNSADPVKPYTWKDIAQKLAEAGIRHAVVSGLLLNVGAATEKNREEEISFPDDQGVKVKDAIDTLKGYATKIAEAQNVPLEKLALQRWLKENLVPMGCMGLASIGLMQSLIDVTLSPVSSPEWVSGTVAHKVFSSQWYSQSVKNSEK